MSFNTASADVRNALQAGAFWVLSGMESIGASPSAMFERLKTVFFQMNQNYQAAQALTERYLESRRVGGLLDQRTTDRPLTDELHVGLPCGTSGYRYYATVPMHNLTTDTLQHRLVVVDSPSALGQISIKRIADELAQAGILGGRPDLAERYVTDWYVTGAPNVTQAFKCI